MHPGRRPYPDSTHVLEEATELAQRGRVSDAREGALDAVKKKLPEAPCLEAGTILPPLRRRRFQATEQ
eukprot:674205-Pleurochrysis_carterae.AAC.1